MRVVKEFSRPDCKITIYSWNNRYIVKLEQGTIEQTFKIDALDIENDEAVLKVLDAEFLQQALIRFQDMGQSLYEAIERTR